MFPSLHRDVANAVSNDLPSTWFNNNKNDINCDNEYSTNVMAKFVCRNNNCPTNGWASKMVTIVIRGFPGNGYNALVFSQRCKSCQELGTLQLNEASYVERVAYRIRKWAGISVESTYHGPREGPPHETSLCEGCRSGFCTVSNRAEYY
jgi:hypothetical protein